MQGHTGKHQLWSGGRSRSEGKALATAFGGVSLGKERQGRVNILRLANLNNSNGLWGIGIVRSCLVPGPGVIKVEEHCFLECTNQKKEML